MTFERGNSTVVRSESLQAGSQIRTYELDEVEPVRIRRIEVFVPDRDETMVFLANHFDLAASTVAAIYKRRWPIEFVFKALEQNRRIKTFVGTCANAMHKQVWIALTATLQLP